MLTPVFLLPHWLLQPRVVSAGPWSFGRLWMMWGLAGGCLLLTGCPGGASFPQTPAKEASAAAQESTARCQDLLTSITATFDLESLGVSADVDHGVSLCNQWLNLCQGQRGDEFPVSEPAAKQRSRWLTSAQAASLRRTAFDARDGQYLRDALLVGAVQRQAIGDATGDLGRAVRLFAHVVRNIELQAPAADSIPLTLWEVYLLGQGTAADRAWLFVELLRQLRIDAVILEPERPAEAPAPAVVWVGVLLDGQVYLFDPFLGLPLPGTGTGGPAGVLTLQELQAHPEQVAAWGAGPSHPYPLRPEEVARLRPALVGTTPLWSSRMQRLQTAFSGSRALVISDPLEDQDGKPGLAARVLQGLQGRFPEDACRTWEFPEARWEGYRSLNATQQQTLLKLTDPWNAPLALVEKNQQVAIVPTRKYFFARIAQTMGRHADAVMTWTMVQLQSKLPPEAQPPARERNLLQRAEDDAAYWAALCKLEQGTPADRKIAIERFRKYLGSFPEGVWRSACLRNLAQALHDEGDAAAAVALLNEIPDTHPQHLGHQYLVKLWSSPAPTRPTGTP